MSSKCCFELISLPRTVEHLIALIIQLFVRPQATMILQLVRVLPYRYCGGKNEDYKLDSLLSHKDSHVICGSEDGRICFWDLVEVCCICILNNTSSCMPKNSHDGRMYMH